MDRWVKMLKVSTQGMGKLVFRVHHESHARICSSVVKVNDYVSTRCGRRFGSKKFIQLLGSPSLDIVRGRHRIFCQLSLSEASVEVAIHVPTVELDSLGVRLDHKELKGTACAGTFQRSLQIDTIPLIAMCSAHNGDTIHLALSIKPPSLPCGHGATVKYSRSSESAPLPPFPRYPERNLLSDVPGPMKISCVPHLSRRRQIRPCV
mmetsp:Transcript_5005/g.15019  ORF Transcript_5005/g.15019 Transcript_5005/m.15019 type:complete len:206 (-) Transcript_5005:137-754(-)